MTSEEVEIRAGARELPRQSRRWALALSLAVVLGAAAGIWTTWGRESSATDTAYPFYEQALQAYKERRNEDAVRLIEKGLNGRLRMSGNTDKMDVVFKRLGELRELGRRNSSFSLELANMKQKDEALHVNGLTFGIADQLLDQEQILFGLVGVALNQIGYKNRAEILNTLGESAAAREAEAEYQTRRNRYRTEVKPKLDAFVNNAPTHSGPLARWKIAREEEKLMREIAEAWKSR